MSRSNHSSRLLWFALLMMGCPGPAEKKAEPTAAESKAVKAAPPKTPEAHSTEIKPPEGTGPVAKVNEVQVGRDLFNREYVQTLERYQKARHDVKPALKERLKDNIVRRLVDAEIIRQQAKIMKIEITDEERTTKWAEHKKRYGNDDAFRAFLERAGTSEADVKRQFDNNLVREKVFARVSDGVELDPKEIKEFYDKNQQRYDEPEQVRASHILIRVPPNSTDDVKAEKKKKAEMIAKKAKTAKFEDLAKEFGEDPTSKKDPAGDLGYFRKGSMVKPFEEAAWKLGKGKVSGVVETQFGFHIIKKMDHKKARKKPFKEVKEQIERSLKARKRNSAIREALAKWKQEAKIEIFVKGDQTIIQAARKPPVAGAKVKKGAAMPLQLKKLGKPNTTDVPVKK